MPVWFVYRSFDMGPTGKHLRRFVDDPTLDMVPFRAARDERLPPPGGME